MKPHFTWTVPPFVTRTNFVKPFCDSAISIVSEANPFGYTSSGAVDG